MGKYEKQLEKSVEDIQRDLAIDKQVKQKDKNRGKERRAFLSLPTYNKRMEFWCDHCSIDFVAPAYKVWSDIHNIGSWHSFCPYCEIIVYRHITMKNMYPYYNKSEKVKHMRSKSFKDMLQPGDYGFKTMYGDAFAQSYNRFQMQHENIFNKYASMGLTGKSLKQKSEEEVMQEKLMGNLE